MSYNDIHRRAGLKSIYLVSGMEVVKNIKMRGENCWNSIFSVDFVAFHIFYDP